MRKYLTLVFVIVLSLLAFGIFPAPAARAVGSDVGVAVCTASPSEAPLGTKVTITCSGFTPNVIVNTYSADQTGFAEVGRTNYTFCLVNGQGENGNSGKVNEKGDVTFYWYTQNGVNSCPVGDYSGVANQPGNYTIVVQELKPGGIKTVGMARVMLFSEGGALTGATLTPAQPSVKPGKTLTFIGSGFAPNEWVSLWATIPPNCSGMGWTYWSAFGAVDLSAWGPDAGITGEANIRTDSNGSFTTTVLMTDMFAETFPCLGTWALSARSLKTGIGAIAYFEVAGEGVSPNAMVWTDETSVPAIGQMYDCGSRGCGIGVHVNGNGFPAGSQVSCWFTRPDGTLYIGWNLVGADSETQS
ncbi:MAG: hypothetical protein ACM3JD_03330, partial [Rudaea sp.]